MLEVVCWLWKPKTAYRSHFGPEHVNTLRRMVERHYPCPHRFNVITDHTEGFDPGIRVIPLWSDHAGRESIYGPDTPSCYRRLRAFSPDMLRVIGKRFISLDLDVVIVGDVTPVFNRTEDFIIWGGLGRRTPWNGSMWMMDAGARADVWANFEKNPDRAITKARGAGFYGSDQAWMNYSLGPKENHWNETHGVYSFRLNLKSQNGALPKDARIVFFEGRIDPWSPAAQQQCPWITEHYK